MLGAPLCQPLQCAVNGLADHLLIERRLDGADRRCVHDLGAKCQIVRADRGATLPVEEASVPLYALPRACRPVPVEAGLAADGVAAEGARREAGQQVRRFAIEAQRVPDELATVRTAREDLRDFHHALLCRIPQLVGHDPQLGLLDADPLLLIAVELGLAPAPDLLLRAVVVVDPDVQLVADHLADRGMRPALLSAAWRRDCIAGLPPRAGDHRPRGAAVSATAAGADAGCEELMAKVRITTASWREMYARMLRAQVQAFDGSSGGEVQIDRVYSFFTFCYHLKDWITNDPAVPGAVRAAVEPFVTSSHALSLAGDIANGVKHYVRDAKRARVDARARIEARGARLGLNFVLGSALSPLGANVVVTGDLGPRRARALAEQCVQAWDGFLKANGLVA